MVYDIYAFINARRLSELEEEMHEVQNTRT